jgi:hypothetical protein
MTRPKSLGPSLHAQPEPCDSVVSLGISSAMTVTSLPVVLVFRARVPAIPPQTLADVSAGIHRPQQQVGC